MPQANVVQGSCEGRREERAAQGRGAAMATDGGEVAPWLRAPEWCGVAPRAITKKAAMALRQEAREAAARERWSAAAERRVEERDYSPHRCICGLRECVCGLEVEPAYLG
jgi:hypothetical protein